MLPLRSLQWTDIAPSIQPGDMLLYVAPKLTCPRKPGWRSLLGQRLESVLAGLPLGYANGAAARSDWTSVACLTIYDKEPHVVTYALTDTGQHEFCLFPAIDFLVEKRVRYFAIRPLITPGARDLTALCAFVEKAISALNSSNLDPVRTDDVALASELYWQLTGTNLAEADDALHPRSVSQIFASGGIVDSLMFSNAGMRRQFQFGHEVTGYIDRDPRVSTDASRN